MMQIAALPGGGSFSRPIIYYRSLYSYSKRSKSYVLALFLRDEVIEERLVQVNGMESEKSEMQKIFFFENERIKF